MTWFENSIRPAHITCNFQLVSFCVQEKRVFAVRHSLALLNRLDCLVMTVCYGT
jgi:hypothetical protein